MQDGSGGGGLGGDENVMAVAGEDGQHYVVLEVIQMDEDEDGDNQVGHHEVDGHEKVKVIAGGGGHPQVSQIACTALFIPLLIRTSIGDCKEFCQ